MFTVDSEGVVTENRQPDPGLLIITAINTRTGDADVVLQGWIEHMDEDDNLILNCGGERVVVRIDDEDGTE